MISFVGEGKQLAGLFAAMAKVQGDLGVALKDREGQSGRATYKYADLNAIDNAFDTNLESNGIAPMFFPGEFSPDGGVVSASFVLAHKDGGAVWTHMSIPMIETVAKDGTRFFAPQPFGSALTYIRRYTYNGVFRIVTEDDDGSSGMNERINAGTGNQPPPNNRQQQAPVPQGEPAPRPLTGYEAVKETAKKMKFPSQGIIGAYLADANGRGPKGEPVPVLAPDADKWLRDNEGATALSLLVTAADWYTGEGSDEALRNLAADWMLAAEQATGAPY